MLSHDLQNTAAAITMQAAAKGRIPAKFWVLLEGNLRLYAAQAKTLEDIATLDVATMAGQINGLRLSLEKYRDTGAEITPKAMASILDILGGILTPPRRRPSLTVIPGGAS